MRAGAVGINLTQANRVFLMEPALNPALEAQAIGRVHRLGQKHKVEVLRLIMTESVETRMLKLSAKKFGTTFGSDDEEDSSGNSSGDEAKRDGGNDADDEDGDGDNRKMAASPASAQKKKKKKPHKDAPGEVATGALRQDKAQMAADEFDLLFGIGEGEEAAAPAAAAAGQVAAGANSNDSGDDEIGDMAI
jgi:superfamily II DNA or RNA helicase